MDVLLEVRHFKKKFGTKQVHRDISFQLQKGECLGLIGGSGSGKSVLLRSLIGLEKPDEGELFFQGQNISNFNEEAFIPVRKKIAYVFQGGALFDSMSVFENLAYPLRNHTQLTEPEIEKKILDLLQEFGLAGNEALLPSSLSGGMQKRVGLARSIILGPEVILYDEPTAGLDPFNTRKIEDMIQGLKKKGTTSVLVTHDMPVAFQVCDRIAFLKEGYIAEVIDKKDLRQEKGLLHQFSQGEIP